MNVKVGDRVKATQPIGGFTRQTVPVGAPGVVVRTTMGRADVCFTLPGVAGGFRTVEVSVDPGKLAKV
ncbi:hypothetical protein ACFZBU_26540 [Embleya sp. NPDC008237]|uniref:hypothetical protein n=1 Tax=Embleya sp. NPDC008237 TaxID=3363978 RepID=UPI0036E93359